MPGFLVWLRAVSPEALRPAAPSRFTPQVPAAVRLGTRVPAL